MGVLQFDLDQLFFSIFFFHFCQVSQLLKNALTIVQPPVSEQRGTLKPMKITLRLYRFFYSAPDS